MPSGFMDERKRRILKVVTDDYIASAEPVGSRTIARKYDLGLSPATIRNEMADLEEEGYLQQPYTSAGRIPSDRGYRYYVDALMEKRRLRPDEIIVIKHEMAARDRAIGSIIHQAARALAQFTHFPSLVLSPDRQSAIFQHVRLVRLDARRVLLLVVTDTGQVENRFIESEAHLADAEIEHLSILLNERLHGRPVYELLETLEKDIHQRMQVSGEFFHQALQALVDGSQINLVGQIVMDGTAQILDQPEFTEKARIRPLLALLEQEEALYHLLVEASGGERLKVSIGQENKEKAMRDCSVVTAVYEVHDRVIGTIGVLGPTRMDYAKALAAVEFIAVHLSSILNNLAG